MATQTFHLFGSLPMELQIEVWKLAFSAEDPHDYRRDTYQYYTGPSFSRLLFCSPYSACYYISFHSGGTKAQV